MTSLIGLSLTNSNLIPPNAKLCRFASCVTLLLIQTLKLVSLCWLLLALPIFLGVWLQNDLKWDTQVNYKNKNAAKRLFMLRSLKRFGFNKFELVTVYKSFIRPLLEYSDVIWHSSLTSNQIHQLERVQKRALRIILGTDYISYANALDVCDVDRLSARREQHSLKFAQSLPKCSRTSKLLPPCRGQIHGRQLRNNAKLIRPCARTNRYACSPIPYYVELINSKLP